MEIIPTVMCYMSNFIWLYLTLSDESKFDDIEVGLWLKWRKICEALQKTGYGIKIAGLGETSQQAHLSIVWVLFNWSPVYSGC